MDTVTAAVLAGGLGTRLRSVVADRPKVLAEVRGTPFLSYLLAQIANSGITRTVLCTGYRGEMIEEAFGGRFRDMELIYSKESEPLGTGGALRYALPHLRRDHVLVMNGDSYCDADIPDFFRHYQKQGNSAAMIVVPMPDTSRYGRVKLDEQGRILCFMEKGQDAGEGWINAGIYLLGRNMVEGLEPGRMMSLEREVFPHCAAERMTGFKGCRRFIDIGTPESYDRADIFFHALEQVRREKR